MRQAALLLAKIAVSGVLLYFALRNLHVEGLLARLQKTKLTWIVAAFALTLFQVIVGAWRWQEISRYCDADMSSARAIKFNFIGSFFNQTLPSTIGGDAVRLWLLARAGAGWRAATYSIFVDRAIGMVALVAIIIASLPWSSQLIGNAQGRSALYLLDLGAMAVCVGFLIFGRLSWTWITRWAPIRHLHACAVVANNIIFSRQNGPRIAILSFVIHFLAVLIAWCIARAVASTADFTQIFLLIPPVMLITMVPMSIAGWGVREATMVIAFGYAGLPQSDGLIVSLIFGAVFFAVGAVGGLVWITSAEKGSKMPLPSSADLA